MKHLWTYRRLWAVALIALLGLYAGCYTSQEDQDAYMEEARREIILTGTPSHLRPSNPLVGDSVAPMRWESAFWRENTDTTITLHGNGCHLWRYDMQPVPLSYARYWWQKHLAETDKPKSEWNLDAVMRNIDGRRIRIHCHDKRLR